MGPHEQPNVQLYLDNERVGQPGDYVAMAFDAATVAFTAFADSIWEMFPRSLSLSLPLQHWSRKRFIKMMMAKGVQRNNAKRLAAQARRFGGGYHAYYLWYMLAGPHADHRPADCPVSNLDIGQKVR